MDLQNQPEHANQPQKSISTPARENSLNRLKPIKVTPQKIKENQVLSQESAELRNVDSGGTNVSAGRLLQATKSQIPGRRKSKLLTPARKKKLICLAYTDS